MNKIQFFILFLAVSSVFVACQKSPNDPGTEYAPQMYVSKPYEPLSQVKKNDINPKGLNMREPAEGSIPRRRFNTNFLVEDSTGGVIRAVDYMVYNDIAPTDYETAAATLKNPYPHTETVIKEGKVLYNRFCYPCHGEKGDGKGPVAELYKGVANLKGSAYTVLPQGHIFHVITHGKGRMWPHGSQLSPDERWKVVHYVLELQERGVPKDIEFTADKGSNFTLSQVLFKTGSAELDVSSRRELDRLAIFMIENAKVAGKISGHTDDTGDVEKNKTLSAERAKTVFDYLVSKGVNTKNLSFEGFGATQPVASNEDEAGRAQNRRIEFQII